MVRRSSLGMTILLLAAGLGALAPAAVAHDCQAQDPAATCGDCAAGDHNHQYDNGTVHCRSSGDDDCEVYVKSACLDPILCALGECPALRAAATETLLP